MNDWSTLAKLLFPDCDKTPQDYETLYPPRTLPEGARVVRFAPSPTGFLHLGNLMPAFIDTLTAKATDGVFILRIEDTDKKREVEGGVALLLSGLAAFGITPDEGVVAPGEEKGIYGPYTQRQRRDIYQCYGKALVEKGLAYPCFCSEEELNALRAEQEKENVNKGYYGRWTRCRDLTLAQQEQAIREGRPWVLRLRSDGDESRRVTLDDLARGKIEMPENIMDAVLLKTDGIPTYHFAHAVDDPLMRVTHVVRGDEWLASVPLHIALFRACGHKLPKYVHIAPLMKQDGASKRKLSKRKDPEAAVSYFAQQGYPLDSVWEYIMILLNSNFEDWRRANPTAPRESFPFNLKKLSASGALFDLLKLNDISKTVIAQYSAEQVYGYARSWAEAYEPALAALLARDPAFAVQIFAIDRGGKKPRKDITMWSQVRDYIRYFYDDLFQQEDALPQQISPADAQAILAAYKGVYTETDDRDGWFARMKAICTPLGFAPEVKEYKANPALYKGHVGDVSTVVRLAVTGRRNTPDLYAILQLLGRQRVLQRLELAEQTCLQQNA